VVGADDNASRTLACAVYESYGGRTVPVSTAATAEAVKISENIFRAVNIALVNELKIIYQRMGINIWEVIDAAKTKPFGFMPFYPGPGLGGHCIPIDPYYLTWKAKEYEISTKFIELAGQVNSAMPDHVVQALARALDARFRKGLNGSRILLLGIAYKKNVDDLRESPSLRLIEKLEALGAEVDYFDPFFPIVPQTREHAALAGRESIAWTLSAVAGYDAVLIATDHDGIDYRALASHARLVVDTRNACANAQSDPSNVVLA
jgi:UDP-N-acetyl-D-glucosamine dehydrogenase